MTGTGEDRIKDLLAAGWTLLEAGRSREAGDAFGRVFLQNPEHDEARRGLEAARLAAAEEARELDARIEEARGVLAAGDRPAARALLEDVVRRGGDRDRARALLDRVEDHGGRLEIAGSALADSGEPMQTSLPPHGTWSRPAFAAACAFLFFVLAAGLALSWDRLVDGLLRPPASHAQAHESASAAGYDAARGGAAQ